MQAGVPQLSRKCRIVKLSISPRSNANRVAIRASRSTSAMRSSAADRKERASMVISPFWASATFAKAVALPRYAPPARSPRPRLEISQVRRRLVLLRRHEQPVRAQHIVLVADHHMIVVLAILFGPERPRIRHAPIVLHHGPGSRQRMVDDRDLVVRDLVIRRVDEDPLLDDRLIVLVQRQSAA